MKNMDNSEVMTSYDFYNKNFPTIKFSIDKKFDGRTNNILLLIFYDNFLYEKYKNIKNDFDFINLLKTNFIESKEYNNENIGVFIICGNLRQTIDFVINEIFVKGRELTKKELDSIGIKNGMKSNSNFYVNLIQIIFFESQGTMLSKFNQLENDFN